MSQKTTKSVAKKWPINPKYQNVKPVVDSGSSVRKYLENIEELHRNFKFHKDEIFRRIKLETFVRLVLEVWMNQITVENETDALQRQQFKTDSGASLEMSNSSDSLENSDMQSTDRATTSRSTLHGVISGIGELDLTKGGQSPKESSSGVLPQPKYDQHPYLLLDVRDAEAYSGCHILSALNYPHTMLSRVMNYETKDLLNYKNKPGCIIVVYDEDEMLSQKVATTLVQRGYDNVYLLSGGLNLACRRFSDGLVAGSLPKPSGETTDGARRVNRSIQSIAAGSQNGFTINGLRKLEQEIDFYLASTSGPFRRNPSLPNTHRGQGDHSPNSSVIGTVRQQDQHQRKPWK